MSIAGVLGTGNQRRSSFAPSVDIMSLAGAQKYDDLAGFFPWFRQKYGRDITESEWQDDQTLWNLAGDNRYLLNGPRMDVMDLSFLNPQQLSNVVTQNTSVAGNLSPAQLAGLSPQAQQAVSALGNSTASAMTAANTAAAKKTGNYAPATFTDAVAGGGGSTPSQRYSLLTDGSVFDNQTGAKYLPNMIPDEVRRAVGLGAAAPMKPPSVTTTQTPSGQDNLTLPPGWTVGASGITPPAQLPVETPSVVTSDQTKTGVAGAGGGTVRTPSSGGQSSVGAPTITGANGGAANPDVFRQNDMYDIGDIGKAFRNVLREMGYDLNPFHGFGDSLVGKWAPAAFSQYVTSLINGERGVPGSEGRGADLKDFLSRFVTGGFGGDGIRPWGYQQAQQGIGQMNSLLRQVGSTLSGAGKTPEEIAAMPWDERLKALSGMNFDPMLGAIASLVGSSPDMMRGFVGGAYSGSMGPALSSAYNQMLGVQQQNWEDYQKAATFEKGKPAPTFLDMITGSMNTPFGR